MRVAPLIRFNPLKPWTPWVRGNKKIDCFIDHAWQVNEERNFNFSHNTFHAHKCTSVLWQMERNMNIHQQQSVRPEINRNSGYLQSKRKVVDTISHSSQPDKKQKPTSPCVKNLMQSLRKIINGNLPCARKLSD